MKNPPIDHRRRGRRQKKRGFTLIEAAIALGIIGIVLAAVWWAGASVNNKNNVNQAAQELQTISQNMIGLYQNRPWPAALMGVDIVGSGFLIPTGVIPQWAVIDATDATHPWGSILKVFAGPGGTNNLTFRISFYNVPLDACMGLLTEGTGCDPTQSGCPKEVYTEDTGQLQLPDPVTGWQTLIASRIQTMCDDNTPTANSVEFDFAQ